MKKGFTLIELIVVIAIIGILSAIIAPNAFRAIEKAKIAKIESDLKTFKTAAIAYYADTGRWPVDGAHWFTDEEVRMFITGVGQPVGWDGPYLEKWPDPPWHCTFTYGTDTVSGSYDWDYWVGWSYWGSVSPGTETCGVSVSCVPQVAAIKVDQHLDNGDVNSGKMRWSGGYAGGFMTVIIIQGGEGM